MTGIGVLLIVMQLPQLLGHHDVRGGTLHIIGQLPRLVSSINAAEFILGSATVVLLIAFPASLRRLVPPHLVALILGTLASLTGLFGIDAFQRIGTLPVGLPTFVIPAFPPEQLTWMLSNGIILGVLGAIDTLLTAMIADSLTRDQHDPNRELLGQGIGNVASGLFGGLPGAGATMGTVVNIQVGASSPAAGIIRATILLSVMVLLAPHLSLLPTVVLSAIALKVGVDIVDWSFIRRAHRLSREYAFTMYLVLALTVFVDLIVAVGIGMFIANLLTIERLSRLQESNVRSFGIDDAESPLTDDERKLIQDSGRTVALLHLSGPMIFGVAKNHFAPA